MNLFPRDITMPSGDLHRECRIVSDGRTVTAWKWQVREFVVVFEDVPASHLKPNGAGGSGSVKLPDGVATFVANGCGCSNPLKGMTPTLNGAARRHYTTPETAP